jgi:hypothetical protein
MAGSMGNLCCGVKNCGEACVLGDVNHEALPSPSLAVLLAGSLCQQHRGACSD